MSGAADVLLIEDDPNDASLARRVLQDAGGVGISIEHITDGAKASEYLSSMADSPSHPKLVLLDLKLPKFDGFAVLSKIREMPNWSRVPVVVLSSSSIDSDVLRSYTLGANAYVLSQFATTATVRQWRVLRSSGLRLLHNGEITKRFGSRREATMTTDKAAKPKVTKVLLVDDHQVVLDGLELMLRNVDWIEQVGRASTGEDAVRIARKVRPDLVVMDLQMPGISGIEAMSQILEINAETKFVVLTMVGERDDVFEAIDAGAQAYLLKNSTKTELIHAIETAKDGGSMLSPGLLEYLSGRRNGGEGTAEDELSFTPREIEILTLMSRGYANKQIAGELSVSESTVKVHVTNVLSKFGASDRTQAVVEAIRAGVIEI